MNPLRSALKRTLAFLGLAPIRQVRALLAAVARADARADGFKRRLAAVREDLRTRTHETKRIAKARDAAAREMHVWRAGAEGSKAEAAESKATAEAWKDRAAQYRTNLRETKRKLDRVEQTTRLAHEHLMSTEVKLDLVDAAIRTLDGRTRTVLPDGPPAATASSDGPSGDAEGE